MSDHTIRSFDVDLGALSGKILEMARLAQKQLADALDALEKSDVALAEQVIASDEMIDALQRDIEEKAIVAIARWQPMAVDLREIVATLRMSYDIERIGDLGESVARRTIALAGAPRIGKAMQHFQGMARLVLVHLACVIESYECRDITGAMEIWRKDEEIDTLGNALFRELLSDMSETPDTIAYCTHVLFCAKSIERVGDHVSNIAESIYYIVEGRPLPKLPSRAASAGRGALPPAA